jgi:hypothetical protein
VSLKIYTLLLLIASTHAWARSKHAIIMGGGGEPKRTFTIFDREIENFKDFIKKDSAWKVSTTYNGGHSSTEKILSDGLVKGSVQPFTEKSYDEMLKVYENKILKGEIKKGDQLLVYISSHGAAKKEGDKTHQISTSGGVATDLTTLEGSKTVSLDKLQDLIDLANQKGIKLGVLDFSCFSGNTLALANPNTCIISSAAPDNFGWAGHNTFSDRFTMAMAPGKSLEELFLHSFADRGDISFPMISTSVGQEIQNELYELMSPYLYKWNQKKSLDNLMPHLENQVIENKCGEADESYKKILAFSDQAEKIITSRPFGFSFFKGSKEFEEFEEAVTKYYELQDRMRDDLTKLHLPFVKTKGEKFERFCSSVKEKITYEFCAKWTINNLVSMDFEENRKLLEKQLKDKDPYNVARARAGLENLKKGEARKEEILKDHPEFERYHRYYKELPTLVDKTYEMALNVSQKTQVIYKKLYEERSKNQNEKNACKDFIL